MSMTVYTKLYADTLNNTGLSWWLFRKLNWKYLYFFILNTIKNLQLNIFPCLKDRSVAD